MRFTDVLGLVLSFLGVLSIFRYIRLLFPRNCIPLVSVQLDETDVLLNNAEAVGAIPSASQSRITFQILHNQFLRLRTTSHRSPSYFQQLKLTFWSGLICKLYVLYSQIDTLKLEVERMLDEHTLALASTVQTATTTALPVPAAITATPTANVAEPTPPPPAVVTQP